MYERTLKKVIQKVNAAFPVMLISGPRQVGKTTLLEMCAEVIAPMLLLMTQM